MKNIILKVEGMTCSGCEAKIENKLKKKNGVIEVKANHQENVVYISYEEGKIEEQTIISEIKKLDYSVKNIEKEQNKKTRLIKLLGVIVILIAIYLIIQNTIGFNFIPEINQSMGYGMLFLVGIITSLHCMAMCGGLNLSQCIRKNQNETGTTRQKLAPSLLYNLGRIISYTTIGGIVGAIGSIISIRRIYTRDGADNCRNFNVYNGNKNVRYFSIY